VLLLLKLILEFLLYLFAAYGFVVLTSELCSRTGIRRPIKGIRIQVKVKDCQDSIEGMVKTLLRSGLPQKLTEDRGITVIDCGSTDETPQILKRLEKDLDNLYLA
jgi:hypothetical protein